MHRIDAADHVANQFSDGNKTTGIPGTLVDAAWLNAIQEELSGFIEAAGVALVKGTNTQLAAALTAWLQAAAHTFTAKQTFNGATGDENAAVELGGAVTTRKLKAELPGTAGNMKTRLYSLPDGTLEIVVGAAWVPSGPYWESDGYDLSTACSKLVLGRSSVALYRYSDDMFADSAWILHARFGLDGRIKFAGVTAGIDGSNPPADTPITNELRAANVCKAWGTFEFKGTATPKQFNTKGGINVSGLVDATGGRFGVNFASPMADGNYAPIITSKYGLYTPKIIAVETTGFSFEVWSTDGVTQITPSSATDAIFYVHVFGNQDS